MERDTSPHSRHRGSEAETVLGEAVLSGLIVGGIREGYGDKSTVDSSGSVAVPGSCPQDRMQVRGFTTVWDGDPAHTRYWVRATDPPPTEAA